MHSGLTLYLEPIITTAMLRCVLWLAALGFVLCGGNLPAAEVFHVVTYNLENYLEQPAGARPVKSPGARAKIRESLRAVHAEVAALQEVGNSEALQELRAALKAEGLDYPYWELAGGADANIHLAVLSQFPIIARRSHTNDSFLLFGRRMSISRGFAEVDVQVNPEYRFTLLAAHLKSRRPAPQADEADWREQEALVLRGIINERLQGNSDLNLIVVGDFNDTQDSKTVRTLLGRSRSALVDTRPAERLQPQPNATNLLPVLRPITWTYAYEKTDTYSRIDYILISRGLAREWQPKETYVLNLPDWGLASDHRPVVAGFVAANF